MEATRKITETTEIHDLSKDDLLDLLEDAIYIIARLDEKLEDFEPAWYSSSADISESNDYLRNVGDWLLLNRYTPPKDIS